MNEKEQRYSAGSGSGSLWLDLPNSVINPRTAPARATIESLRVQSSDTVVQGCLCFRQFDAAFPQPQPLLVPIVLLSLPSGGWTFFLQRPGAVAPFLQQRQTRQVFLKNLFVLPEERRRGIARELVKGAEAFARKEKAAAICLDVGRKNAAARELYLSCGFEEAERPGPVEGGVGGALLKSLGMGKRYMVKVL